MVVVVPGVVGVAVVPVVVGGVVVEGGVVGPVPVVVVVVGLVAAPVPVVVVVVGLEIVPVPVVVVVGLAVVPVPCVGAGGVLVGPVPVRRVVVIRVPVLVVVQSMDVLQRPLTFAQAAVLGTPAVARERPLGPSPVAAPYVVPDARPTGSPRVEVLWLPKRKPTPRASLISEFSPSCTVPRSPGWIGR